jgi:hypothetical protein
MRMAAIALLLLASPAFADGVEALLGTWVSPDGFAKNNYVRHLDGDWIETHMWFRTDDGWDLVSQGAMYQRPGEDAWVSISRAREMGAIELFESVFRFADDGSVSVSNVAYTSDGRTMPSEEEWQLDGDTIRYEIFEIVDGERQAMMSGEWKKLEEKE